MTFDEIIYWYERAVKKAEERRRRGSR